MTKSAVRRVKIVAALFGLTCSLTAAEKFIDHPNQEIMTPAGPMVVNNVRAKRGGLLSPMTLVATLHNTTKRDWKMITLGVTPSDGVRNFETTPIRFYSGLRRVRGSRSITPTLESSISKNLSSRFSIARASTNRATNSKC